MASSEASVDVLLSQGRFGRSEAIALVLAALAVAAGAAAWIDATSEQPPVATAALPATAAPAMTFETRFAPASASATAYSEKDAIRALDRFAMRGIDRQLLDARAALVKGMESRDAGARDLNGSDWRPTLTEGNTVAMPAPGVPLPRPRPSVANLPTSLVSASASEAVGRVDDRSILQKLSDMLPSPTKFASLGPDSGIVRSGVDLGALGYERTAVYDIKAKMVYLPSGIGLEAHSGMGNLRDDPEHVNQRMVGATPPATYDLKPREKPFHGVRALRMNVVEGSTLGRSGLLTHPYMLGPEGDSNGCVSIKNYDRFLKAYDDGEFNRLVVVVGLEAGTPTRTAQKTE
ncbi:DUF2778 domain-containing protein [Bradyrhizobium sp. 83012]|uniref:DUF2778 domain-containing protein n=1 Tax=Bradyrhizobium aeschynomenes TaxID=2734909 RepID=A0ABX2C879_9BRAD|nr:DUF2778 domain-containing protein [Bradyrhizobium aeschynomenes]NPU14643.1 DUF2778 domain-containing protein [Bradyrhizobium aeschynomenes]NPU64469.1 DUF2778 domain-containing protein [Bradyrhizobium aeschynomenes]